MKGGVTLGLGSDGDKFCLVSQSHSLAAQSSKGEWRRSVTPSGQKQATPTARTSMGIASILRSCSLTLAPASPAAQSVPGRPKFSLTYATISVAPPTMWQSYKDGLVWIAEGKHCFISIPNRNPTLCRSTGSPPVGLICRNHVWRFSPIDGSSGFLSKSTCFSCRAVVTLSVEAESVS